jgi:hypothetical protein
MKYDCCRSAKKKSKGKSTSKPKAKSLGLGTRQSTRRRIATPRARASTPAPGPSPPSAQPSGGDLFALVPTTVPPPVGDLLTAVPQDISPQCDEASLQKALLWRRQIYISRSDSIGSRAVHSTEVAAKQAAKVKAEAAKRGAEAANVVAHAANAEFDASIIREKDAVSRVAVADEALINAWNKYNYFVRHTFVSANTSPTSPHILPFLGPGKHQHAPHPVAAGGQGEGQGSRVPPRSRRR